MFSFLSFFSPAKQEPAQPVFDDKECEVVVAAVDTNPNANQNMTAVYKFLLDQGYKPRAQAKGTWAKQAEDLCLTHHSQVLNRDFLITVNRDGEINHQVKRKGHYQLLHIDNIKDPFMQKHYAKAMELRAPTPQSPRNR
jgi:hypothetical protein